MSPKNGIGIIPSKIVMEDYISAAMEYYRNINDKISPYLFRDNLIKMIGFQQLIISNTYKIKREDARSKKGVDYVRECVSNITKPTDLISLMDTWQAFDLCYTAPSFVSPVLASNIRKSYCKVGNKYFDCYNCDKIACKQNLIWNESTIIFDLDLKENNHEEVYGIINEKLNLMDLEFSIKFSSLNGFHINIGLPKYKQKTLLDRSIYHFSLAQELIHRGVPIDDNSLDPVPIIRAPFSLHYKRLTPSLPVNDKSFDDAFEILNQMEKLDLEDRIAYSLDISKGWYTDWMVKHSPEESFSSINEKWGEKAYKSIYRKKSERKKKRTNVGDYLRKGKEMTEEDQIIAHNLLLKEGKTEKLAKKIIEMNIKKHPKKPKIKQQKGDIQLESQKDIPNKILQVPPPLILIIIDNANIREIAEIVGVKPIAVKKLCENTDEGFKMIFRGSKLLKKYPRKWNTKSTYIGGLYSAYNYCAAADKVIAIKRENVWDRDMKILKELEGQLTNSEDHFIAIHLLGLDFCKDNDLETEGAMLVFRKILKEILTTNYNLIVTTDHCEDQKIPYFELLLRSN